MELQRAIWIVLTFSFIVLFLPPVKKNILIQNISIKRTTRRNKGILEKASDIYNAISISLFVCICTFAILKLKENFLSIVIAFYKDVWLVVLLPIIITCFMEHYRLIWQLVLIIYSMVLYFIFWGYDETTEKNRDFYCIVIAVYISLYIIAIFYSSIIEERIKKQKLKRGVWKDLRNRKPNITINLEEEFEISRFIEKSYHLYLYWYSKIKYIDSIEFVGLHCKKIDDCYNGISKRIKIAVLLIALDDLYIFFPDITIIVIILMFLIIIFIAIKVDYYYLKIIGIRLWCDTWGYYIKSRKKQKFVGYFDNVILSKYHKFVYSYLDIVALLRYIDEIDKVKKKELIKYISEDIADIVEHLIYKEKTWIELLPVWIICFLDYKNRNEIPLRSKKLLLQSIKSKNDRANIAIFLQSTLVDYYRKFPEKNDINMVKLFIDNIIEEVK